MEPSQTSFLLITFLILLRTSSVEPQEVAESNALWALKAAFNNHLLNTNWTGLHCSMSEPSKWYGIRCLHGRVTAIILEDIGLTGKISGNALVSFTKLSVLSFKGNSISTRIMNLSFNPKLKQIDLSGNIFYGEISQSLLGLPLLESLQLQDNGLTGPVPEFHQSSLKAFNVSNNNLSGPIPATKAIQSFGLDSFSGNPGLCGAPSHISCGYDTKNDAVSSDLDDLGESTRSSGDKRADSNFQRDFSLYFLIFDILGLLAIVLLFVVYYKKMKKLKEMMMMREECEDTEGVSKDQDVDGHGQKDHDHQKLLNEEGDHGERRLSSPAVVVAGGGQLERRKLIFVENELEVGFEMGDLLKASAEGLGKGISGNSYKAMMEGKPAVVVKRLRDLKPLTSEEFSSLLMLMARLKHPNLLPLLGYYFSKDEKLLIFRYAQKGNLFHRLHGTFFFFSL